MEEEITFQVLYDAYKLCLKNKKNKFGTYSFTNEELCQNLIKLLDRLNNREYVPEASNCYVITEPALREIYAAQFSDRIVQHFYMKEIQEVLEEKFVDGCCSCREGRGNDYALKLLRKDLTTISDCGKRDCFFLKIDLSGYFMSIDRKQVSEKFLDIILKDYKGKYKELLIYLTPIIFENNPSLNCNYRCSEKMRELVPDRRKMNPEAEYGMAIGNLTAQAASNLNLADFDSYVMNELGLESYVRYVDDIVILSNDKRKLFEALPFINKKLQETHQTINKKKTRIDTAYHGVPFLGKVSYPYGYQKPSKQVAIRVWQRAKNIKYEEKDNLLAKTNSQIGSLKNYNCRKLISQYANLLPDEVKQIVECNKEESKFYLKE